MLQRVSRDLRPLPQWWFPPVSGFVRPMHLMRISFYQAPCIIRVLQIATPWLPDVKLLIWMLNKVKSTYLPAPATIHNPKTLNGAMFAFDSFRRPHLHWVVFRPRHPKWYMHLETWHRLTGIAALLAETSNEPIVFQKVLDVWNMLWTPCWLKTATPLIASDSLLPRLPAPELPHCYCQPLWAPSPGEDEILQVNHGGQQKKWLEAKSQADSKQQLFAGQGSTCEKQISSKQPLIEHIYFGV